LFKNLKRTETFFEGELYNVVVRWNRVWLNVTEGKGYCARRQERMSIKKLAEKKLAELVENRDKIVMIPDIKDAKT
jgi:hypothetical protein